MDSALEKYLLKVGERFDAKHNSLIGTEFNVALVEFHLFFENEIRLAYEQGRIDSTRKESKAQSE